MITPNPPAAASSGRQGLVRIRFDRRTCVGIPKASSRQGRVKDGSSSVRKPSGPASGAPAAPSVPLGADGDGSSALESDRGCAAVADVVFVVLTLTVFGLLSMAVRGVERL
jgi:hypothetical protein